MSISSFLPLSFKHNRIAIQKSLPDFLNICQLEFDFCVIESLEDAEDHQSLKQSYLGCQIHFQFLNLSSITPKVDQVEKRVPEVSLSN